MSRLEKFAAPSAVDSLPLSGLLVVPEGEVRGLVQLSHGMIEFKERYLPLMRYLAERGFACQIHDHRGHGDSVRDRRDLGFLYERGDLAMPRDARDMADRLRARFPGRKLCLLGHSMGSLVSLACLRRYPGAFDACLLSGCPADNPAKGAGLLLVRALRAAKGERARSGLLKNMMFGPYSARFTPRSAYNWINTDAEEVRLHETDPNMNYEFTLNGYDALLRLLTFVYGREPYPASGAGTPVLLLSGADDPCAGGAAKQAAVRDRLTRSGYADAAVKIYPGLRHEIFRAPEKDAVFKDALAFLERMI